jgi:hypothetical protein
VDHYVVEKRREDMRAWISMDKSVGGTQFSAERMITGYKYYFRVAGINSTGTGVFCATSDCYLISDPIGMPDPPMHVKITDITASSVSLKWKEPEFTGNLPITGYLVERLKELKDPEVKKPVKKAPEVKKSAFADMPAAADLPTPPQDLKIVSV